VEVSVMISTLPPRKPQPKLEFKTYTICSIAGPCWEAVGKRPEPPETKKPSSVICPVIGPCWRDGRPIIAGERHLLIARAMGDSLARAP